MARPRKSRSPEETDGIAAANVDHSALDQAGADATIYAQQVALVDQQFGIDIAYQLDIFIAAIRQRAAESAVRLIEIGCLLIQIRERETTDIFKQALERIGIAPRFAQRAMQASLKLRDRSSIQALGVSKALELLSEDDDSLAELESGGSIAGLTLDEIDAMSVRELKTALRKERDEHGEEKAADEEIIRKKDERINKLTRDHRRVNRSNARDKVANLMADLDAATIEAATLLKEMRASHSAIQSIYQEEGEALDSEISLRIEQCADTASHFLRELIEEFGE